MRFPQAATLSAGNANQTRQLALVAIAFSTTVVLVVPNYLLAYFGVALLGLLLAILIPLWVLEGKMEIFLFVWVLISPLGYYFLSYPREKPYVTFDRFVILLLVAATCFAVNRNATMIPQPLLRAAVAWLVFLCVAALSLLKISGAQDLLSGIRVLLDAFLLPALLAWCVIHNFPVRRHLARIHFLLCLVALFLAALGMAEIVTGTDFLPILDASGYYAGSGEHLLLRVNGPFSTNNSFGLIGLVIFCFLLFLGNVLPAPQFSGWRQALHWAGVTAALMAALLPLFRSIVITLLVMLILDIWFVRGIRPRIFRAAVVLLVAGAFLVGNDVVPDLYQERVSSSANVYARMAEQRQTLGLFMRNPLLGVGLNNFISSAPHVTPYTGLYAGVDPLDAPHSNLGAVLAETGILGFVPYVLANLLLVGAFWKLYLREPVRSRVVWKYFLYLFLSYWISGLSLTSGHFGDLNLWYLLALATLYKYGLTEAAVANALPEAPNR